MAFRVPTPDVSVVDLTVRLVHEAGSLNKNFIRYKIVFVVVFFSEVMNPFLVFVVVYFNEVIYPFSFQSFAKTGLKGQSSEI
jgi:hypothetical protein